MTSKNQNGVNNAKKKIINDPIHGLMEFEDWAVKFIDTEPFQRLRNIKQLGSVYYVYPGANHSRFEHSLGVAHLAYTLMKKLSQNEKHIKCVTLAALCHDLGHGPFSHVFENDFVPLLRKRKKIDEEKEWKHENKSIEIFEKIVNQLKQEEKITIADLDDLDIKLIKALILGKKKAIKQKIISDDEDKDKGFISDKDGNKWPSYLFEIVSNDTNGIDVDKFDYIARDCYYLGIKTSSDFSRLMNFSQVIDNKLAYYFKERYNIYELFHTRYSLHKRAYIHSVCKTIDFMVCDALVKADEVLDISGSICDLDRFLKMDDTILNQIEYSSNPRLDDSKKIIQNIRTRKLYKLVDEFSIPSDEKELAKLARKKITKENIIANQEGLAYDDVIVEQPRLDYGKGEENPVEHVKFYDKNNKIYDKDEIPEASYIIPEKYEEFIIRVYTRNPEKADLIKKGFQKLKEKENLLFETSKKKRKLTT